MYPLASHYSTVQYSIRAASILPLSLTSERVILSSSSLSVAQSWSATLQVISERGPRSNGTFCAFALLTSAQMRGTDAQSTVRKPFSNSAKRY